MILSKSDLIALAEKFCQKKFSDDEEIMKSADWLSPEARAEIGASIEALSKYQDIFPEDVAESLKTLVEFSIKNARSTYDFSKMALWPSFLEANRDPDDGGQRVTKKKGFWRWPSFFSGSDDEE
jgi:hypothetical protein